MNDTAPPVIEQTSAFSGAFLLPLALQNTSITVDFRRFVRRIWTSPYPHVAKMATVLSSTLVI
jgi:hypothetical protein